MSQAMFECTFDQALSVAERTHLRPLHPKVEGHHAWVRVETQTELPTWPDLCQLNWIAGVAFVSRRYDEPFNVESMALITRELQRAGAKPLDPSDFRWYVNPAGLHADRILLQWGVAGPRCKMKAEQSSKDNGTKPELPTA